jgi:hypothetical protein
MVRRKLVAVTAGAKDLVEPKQVAAVTGAKNPMDDDRPSPLKKRKQVATAKTAGAKDLADPKLNLAQQALAAAMASINKIFLQAGVGRCDATKLLEVLRSISNCVIKAAPQITLGQLSELGVFMREIAPKMEYWRADYVDSDDSENTDGVMEQLSEEVQDLFGYGVQEGYSCGSNDQVVSLEMGVYVSGDEDLYEVEIVYNCEDRDGYFDFLVNGLSADV